MSIKREERAIRSRDKRMKELAKAMELSKATSKMPYTKQPGQEKAARSPAEHERRKLAAHNKREWRAEKRRALA